MNLNFCIVSFSPENQFGMFCYFHPKTVLILEGEAVVYSCAVQGKKKKNIPSKLCEYDQKSLVSCIMTLIGLGGLWYVFIPPISSVLLIYYEK